MTIDPPPPADPAAAPEPPQAARDQVPAPPDRDRGAIGGVGHRPRADLMRAGAFAAVAAIVGLFFVAHGRDGRAPAGSSDALDAAGGPPARSIVDFKRVAADDQDGPRLADAATDPDAPRLLADPETAVPALDPDRHASPAVPARTPAAVMAEAARRAPVIAYGGAIRIDPTPADPDAGVPPSAGAGADGAGDAVPSLDQLRRSSAIGRSRASVLGNRDTLILAGSLIPCILQTALSSAQPGYASCLVPADVYSDNGHVVLMEKGTRVLGEYRGGFQQGQDRLFVLWTRAVTPDGVAIDLASPASDALGRAGIGGTVDTQFWARFGSAILLSLIDNGAAVAGQAAAGNNSPSIRAPARTAEAALEGGATIRPLLRKNQGEEVGIFVAQDLDFGAVYRLRLRR